MELDSNTASVIAFIPLSLIILELISNILRLLDSSIDFAIIQAPSTLSLFEEITSSSIELYLINLDRELAPPTPSLHLVTFKDYSYIDEIALIPSDPISF